MIMMIRSVDLDSDLLKSYVAKQDEPINSKMSPTKIGVVSEKFWSNISKLIDENPDGLIKEKYVIICVCVIY